MKQSNMSHQIRTREGVKFHSIRQQIDFKVKIATLRSRWGDIAVYRNES